MSAASRIRLATLGALSAFALPLIGETVGKVQTLSVGDVEVLCEKAGGWSFAATGATEGGADVITVRLASAEEAKAPAFSVRFSFSGAGVHHIWSPDFTHRAYTLYPAIWQDGKRYASQLAKEMPLLAALGTDDRARLTLATDEAFEKVVMEMVVNERTCRMECAVNYFTETTQPRKDYVTKIRIDRRTRAWFDAIREGSAWISRAANLTPAFVPEAAYDPLYSTWYAYLQDVHAAPLEQEARLAASLGMKTMILDDGWQKEKSASFYSKVGDWMPVKGRFPDMKGHVAAVHKAGLKYMLWLSVPYVGDESEAWKRFSKKFLKTHGTTHPGAIGVLDPRFPDVREYLIETYERVVRDWGFDGVKLDFIDQFVLTGRDPAEKENYAGRDIRSLPAAVDRLMKDVLQRLKAINPNVLVEFRQHYMGPAIRQYGNMIRSADAPADMASNRRRICDLRLTSGETAVHADMLVWSADETPQGAAHPILSALFATIQYSMVLQTIPESQREVIRHWLKFSQDHRATLLKGAFRPHHPEAGYPLVEAESAAERIFAAYVPEVTVSIDKVAKATYVINATSADSLVLELPSRVTAAAFDTVGGKAGESTVGPGLVRLPIPASGYVRLR